MKKKYTLKNKKRFFTILFLILGVMITFLFADISYGIKKREYKLIEIKYGDTLWDIADRYRGNTGIRKFLYEIKKVNSLDTSEIYTGDTLKIPVAG